MIPILGVSPAKKSRLSHDDGNHLTVPKTPQFQTRGRKRQHHIVSQAEIDEQELEDIKK